MSALPPIEHKITELLALRDHSRHELHTKLENKGYAHEDIAQILDDFAQKNWINDRDYAAQLADYAIRKQNGPMKLRQQFYQKGISDDDATEALGKIDKETWAEAARAAWLKRFHGEAPKDAKTANKQWRFLAQRGFSQEHIRTGIPEIKHF